MPITPDDQATINHCAAKIAERLATDTEPRTRTMIVDSLDVYLAWGNSFYGMYVRRDPALLEAIADRALEIDQAYRTAVH